MKKSQRKKKKILLKNQSIARKRKHLVVSWKMIFFFNEDFTLRNGFWQVKAKYIDSMTKNSYLLSILL